MRLARPTAPSLALCLLSLCAASGPWAQTPPPAAPVDGRTARDADNPMRMILEAGKLKLRIKPEADAPAAPRRETPRPRPASAVVVPADSTAKVQPTPARAAASVAGDASAPATPATTPLVGSQASSQTASQTASQSASQTAPATSTPASALAPAAELAAAPAVALPATPAAPLRNILMVEPELPTTLLRRLRGAVEVVVGFTVNRDGSVSEVAVRSSSNPAVDGAVLDAVRQWRYEPLPQARTHAVQLVLRAAP